MVLEVSETGSLLHLTPLQIVTTDFLESVVDGDLKWRQRDLGYGQDGINAAEAVFLYAVGHRPHVFHGDGTVGQPRLRVLQGM